MVVSLLALTSIAVSNSLINGLKIWSRTQELVIEEDIAVLLDKMSQELRNAFNFSQISFEGKETRIKFATIVRTPADAGQSSDEYIPQVGQVEYYFDALVQKLYRRQSNYSLALKNKFFPERLMLSSVKSLKFYYFYQDEEGKLVETNGDVLPSAVRADLEFFDNQGGQKFVSRFIYVPTGI